MKKNIAIIITKLNGGGAERCASNLSVELSKHYNVFLITFDAANVAYPYGGKLIDLNIPKSNGGIKRYIGVLKRTLMLRKIKKENLIDVSISLLEGPNLVNVLSKRRDKTIVSIRNCMSKQCGGRFANAIIKFASKKADLTVSLSEMVKADMVENYAIPSSKIITIYNHVDNELLKKQKSDSSFVLPKGKKFIVNMGRLHHQKGQWHLIRVFKYIADRCPDLNLLILGEGELRQQLEKLVHDLQLTDRVFMPGYIKSPHAYFSKCEMFVFSSLYEGLGNVLLEAEAFGLPIISTDCVAGPREILAPNTNLNSSAKSIEYQEYGILVPVDEKTEINAKASLSTEEIAMADAIYELHNNDKLRNEYVQKSLIGVKRFSKDKIINDWVKVIEQ